MQGVLLVGHGSLRAGPGAAMLRLAARARELGLAPVVEAAFLNYSRPAWSEAMARCVRKGVTRLVIQPYFLVPGKFVRSDLRRLLRQAQQQYPQLQLRLAQPFGDHPALAQLILRRAAAAEQPASAAPAASVQANAGQASGLLIIAHGSPDPNANRPIEHLVQQLCAQQQYAAVALAFLDLNAPGIAEAIAAMARQGLRRLVAVPYFLQLGGHVAEDLPLAIAAARASHPQLSIVLAEHLAYDPLLLEVIADRARTALDAPELAPEQR